MTIQNQSIEVATFSQKAKTLAIDTKLSNQEGDIKNLGLNIEEVANQLIAREIEPEEAAAAVLIGLKFDNFIESLNHQAQKVKNFILELDEDLKDINLKLDSEKMSIIFHVTSEMTRPDFDCVVNELVKSFQITEHTRRHMRFVDSY